MIDKGNDRVNRVIYDGYVINKMYGCDGELVYNRGDEKYGCDTVYLEDYSGGTYTQSCMRENCDCLIGNVKNLIYRHDGIEETITYLNYTQERSITSITIGDCVTSLENSVFGNWSGVTEVTLSPYLVAIYGGGTYGAFYNCKSLRSITFPQHLRSVYDAFENCSSLSSVTFNDELKYLGANSFYGCTSLTDIELPNSVVELGLAAFNGCTSLSSITLSSGITEIEEHTFEGCSSLTDLEIPSSVTAIRGAAFNGCSSLSALTLNEGLESVAGCISGCFALKSVVFPSTFTTFEGGDMMFSNTDVQSVTFLSSTPPTVYGGNIGDVFVNASQLTNIYVPCDALGTYMNAWSSEGTWLTSKLHPIQGSCTVEGKFRLTLNDLTTVSADCTSTVINRDEVGEYSETCISVEFGDCLTEIGYSSFSGFKITELNIPNNVTNIGGYAFRYCTNLTGLTIGNNVANIGDNAFYGCSGLTSCILSNGVKSIGSRTFSQCRGLTTVDIPDSVVSIGVESFSMCRGLTAVTIGSGCTKIGTYGQYTYTFYDDFDLNSVTIKAVTPPEIGQGVFASIGSNYVIYVPSQSLDAYKNARGWTIYASHIQPIGS